MDALCDANTPCKQCVIGPPVCNWIEFDNGTMVCVDPNQPITGSIAHEVFGNDPKRCPPAVISDETNIFFWISLVTGIYTVASLLYFTGKRLRQFLNNRSIEQNEGMNEGDRLLEQAMEDPVHN